MRSILPGRIRIDSPADLSGEVETAFERYRLDESSMNSVAPRHRGSEPRSIRDRLANRSTFFSIHQRFTDQTVFQGERFSGGSSHRGWSSLENWDRQDLFFLGQRERSDISDDSQGSE